MEQHFDDDDEDDDEDEDDDDAADDDDDDDDDDDRGTSRSAKMIQELEKHRILSQSLRSWDN